MSICLTNIDREDALTINRGVQNVTIFDQDGNTLYQQGAGGTEITVVGIEQGRILDGDGNRVYQWP